MSSVSGGGGGASGGGVNSRDNWQGGVNIRTGHTGAILRDDSGRLSGAGHNTGSCLLLSSFCHVVGRTLVTGLPSFF